jgi:hypothetical protein
MSVIKQYTGSEWELIGGGGGNDLLVAEVVVSGTTTNTVEFSGLDSSLSGGYRIEIDHASANPAAAGRMYINGDTVNTNYYNQFFYADGTTLGAARNNDILLISNDSNLPGFCSIDIMVSAGYAMGWFQAGRSYNNAYFNNGVWRYAQSLTNGKITSITLRSYAEDSRMWPSGTTFRLYKRK